MTDTAPQISVVIPARDEGVAIGPLVAEIARALHDRSFEIIVVDDGSQERTRHVVEGLAAKHDWMTWLSSGACVGYSASIRMGVKTARAPLLAPLEEVGGGNVGLVQGQRPVRRDSPAKRCVSRIANSIRGWPLCERGARFRLRAEGLPARRVSGLAVFRPYLSLHAGHDAARGIGNPHHSRVPPREDRRPVKIHQSSACLGRHP